MKKENFKTLIESDKSAATIVEMTTSDGIGAEKDKVDGDGDDGDDDDDDDDD